MDKMVKFHRFGARSYDYQFLTIANFVQPTLQNKTER